MSNEDQWIHRADNIKCKTCMWFVPKVPMQMIVNIPKEPIPNLLEMDTPSLTKPSYDLGRCRRHAPTLSGWPAVFVNDWCGDHKLDENKL